MNYLFMSLPSAGNNRFEDQAVDGHVHVEEVDEDHSMG